MITRLLALPLLLLSPLCNAQWNALTGGGIVTTVRSMTSDAGALYAATYPNGLRKSTNGGTVWTPINNGMQIVGANYFVESVFNTGSILFVGTHTGIYNSSDGGANWNPANGALTANNTVFAKKWYVFGGVTMAVFAGDIASGGGIWRTNNNGASWNIGHSGMGSNARIYNMAEHAGYLFAASNLGLYVSNDNGLNWQLSTTLNYACYAIAANGNNLIALTTFGYRYSTNVGNTWVDATGDPSAPTGGEIVVFDGKVYATVITQGNTTSDVLASLDAGVTWSSVSTGIGPIDITALNGFHVAPSALYMGALFEIYYITDANVAVASSSEHANTLVYPTLFTNGFTVATGQAAGSVALIDAQGRTVRTERITGERTFIDRAGLPSGVYTLLSVSDDMRTLIGRVIAD